MLHDDAVEYSPQVDEVVLSWPYAGETRRFPIIVFELVE